MARTSRSTDTPARLSKAERAWLLKSATYASVLVACSLVFGKVWAWQATDSVSILSSLADSVLDVLASLLTFWAIRYSLEPPDREHRFGHGKSEGLAALLQALIICGSGVFVCYEAVQRLMAPVPIAKAGAGIAVLAASTLATVALVFYQHYVKRKTGSLAISADAMHYKTDVLVNVVVAGAVFGSAMTGLRWLDPLVGGAVALYLVLGAWSIAMHSLDVLLDKEIPEADRRRIRDIAKAHPEVLGFHDLRTRFSGSGYIVQFHLELDAGTSLHDTHEILDQVEAEIWKVYPDCEIIIHPDPLGFAERRDNFEKPPAILASSGG
ncbi:MAG: cation diffusion facilitator family transporter [Chromatiales bacterium]|nr:cation diffusion facilitator family transporter [Chromatiales bacterium]